MNSLRIILETEVIFLKNNIMKIVRYTLVYKFTFDYLWLKNLLFQLTFTKCTYY